MGQIFLVRHGQADWDGEDYDRLIDNGWAQCRRLGQSLADRSIIPDRLVRGAMRRHRESAEGLLQGMGISLSVEVDPGWDEFDHFDVLEKSPEDVPPGDPHAFLGWFERAVHRWTSGTSDDYNETFAAFSERVSASLAALAEAPGTSVVASSGGAIAWAAASLLTDDNAARIPLWRSLNRVLANSSVTRVVTGHRGLTLLGFNEQAHLDGTGLLTYR